MTDELPKRVREFIRGHPDTSPAAVFGRFRDDLDRGDLDAIAAALDADSPEVNPTESDAEEDDERDARAPALAAFADAIDYFHAQLDREIHDHTDDGTYPDRPTTAREYFATERGWAPETINDHRLGWAPADRHALLDELARRGHDRAAILGTGLFYETDDGNLRPLWRGRYVLPYFDADGQPVYAIARCAGDKGGGGAGYDGHPADHLAGKYAKLKHTDDRVPLSEPIWGQHTLADGEAVVVAEGIADAITAAERGYAVLSPVAKEFKKQHFGPLLDALGRFDVPHVVVVPDAERATFDRPDHADDPPDPESIGAALSLPATAPGIGGALRTADYLARHDVDVRVADLPRHGLRKVDLDDYLAAWNDDADAVLASARLPDAFPEYDAATGGHDRGGTSTASDGDRKGAGKAGEGGSALWDLDLGDLTGREAGDRGRNPFRHTGESENYFVVREGGDGDLVATDYKGAGGGVTYNGLTALLVDAGERSRDRPEGDLSDWEVWIAWRQARKRGDLEAGDPVPYRAVLGIARHLANERDLCAESDIPDDPGDPDQTLPAPVYNTALEYINEEAGLAPGREPVAGGREPSDGEPAPRQLTAEDLLESDATLSRREAWRAVATVRPDHLDEPLAIDGDGDGWSCPTCGESTDDVVRAAALADGTLTCCENAFDDPAAYDRLYDDVRRNHGAPLPEYIPPTQAVEDMDRARGAVEALHGWHILDSLESEVTDDAPAGEDAVAVLDPTWEDSESGERIVLFQSGVFYCREHERVLWPLQVVALEQGLVQTETERLGDAFFRAYAHTRTTYDAPLPPIAWNDAEEAPEPVHLPVLPDAEDLLGEGVETDASELDDARADVSDLYDRLADSRGAPNYLLTAYPSLGKSHSAVVHASEYPTLYAATRKEIRQETAERAGSHGVSWMHLPTLGESRPPKPVLKNAVGYVREHGRGALRDRDALLEAVEDTYQAVDQRWPAYDDAYGDGDGVAGDDHDHEDDEVNLDRAACECGDGDHGPEWHLALWTARQLGEKPRDLHVRGETIFGKPVPCSTDTNCPYTAAWERATDPDAPIDLLIGHPVHAYVSGARTQPKRADNSDSIYSEDRVVVFDEFPAGAFMRDVAEEWPQHARWLAACLDARVEDVTDLMDVREDLWDDPFVREWLNGEGSPAVADAIAAKREQASDPDSPDPDWQALVGAEFDVHGDLAALVDRAAEAAADPDRDAEELLDAAQTALQGGREGAEALASGAEDGYAHPDGYWLLTALLAPADHEPDAVPDDDWRRTVETCVTDADHFGYGSDAGRVKSVIVGDHVRLLVDRDMSGATLLTPPQLQANTVIGLDATGRPVLWEPAVGGEFETRDIHETAAERRAFARDVLNLRVVQTSPHVHTYSSNPAGKNFGDDIALVEEIADTFGGHQLAQDRITTTSDPAVVTTKKVEDYIGDDLLQAGADSIDHYGDLIGSNRLGDATVGAVLGAEHYGHDTAERWALLTGEEFDVSGHGTTLDYASPTANAMLRRMWDDQVMQAVMRFGRDEEGAVVFAHTAALRDDLPVVDHGDVATAWTANQRAVAAAAADRAGGPFTVADVADDSRVDCHRRTVRRLLNEFADLGYMHREQGHTNEYELLEEPGTGEVNLPEVDAPAGPSASSVGPSESGQTSVENTNTWFVWSRDALTGGGTRTGADTPTLGPPGGDVGTVPAGPPPG